MAGGHDEHGHDSHAEQGGHSGGHSGSATGEWLNTHLSGAILPFGERMEAFFEHTMFLFVNGVMMKLGVAFLAVTTPVILLEFVLHATRF